MEQLKLVAQALGLPLDSAVEKCVEVIQALDKEAKEARVWKVRAEENLSKLEDVQKTLRENAELRAEAFVEKAKRSYRITAAQAVPLKKMFMSGKDGQRAAQEIVDASADNEYLTRVSSLNLVPEPSDPVSEVEGRSVELISKDPKLSKSDAQFKVLASDPDLSSRYREAMLGTKGGDR